MAACLMLTGLRRLSKLLRVCSAHRQAVVVRHTSVAKLRVQPVHCLQVEGVNTQVSSFIISFCLCQFLLSYSGGCHMEVEKTKQKCITSKMQ